MTCMKNVETFLVSTHDHEKWRHEQISGIQNNQAAVILLKLLHYYFPINIFLQQLFSSIVIQIRQQVVIYFTLVFTVYH